MLVSDLWSSPAIIVGILSRNFQTSLVLLLSCKLSSTSGAVSYQDLPDKVNMLAACFHWSLRDNPLAGEIRKGGLLNQSYSQFGGKCGIKGRLS